MVNPTSFKAAEGFGAVETSKNGVRLQTSLGPLSVEAHAPGTFRLRAGRTDLPDYDLLVKKDADPTLRVDVTVEAERITIRQGDSDLILTPNPLRLELKLAGRTILTSISDQHFRGWSRMPAVGKGEDHWLLSLALVSGEAVYGFGEKWGALNRRGQLITSRIEDALGVNTELAYKNTPFGWSPRGWGVFAHTPATVRTGIGYAQWSHRTLAMAVEDEAFDIFLFTGAEPADLVRRYTALTGRPGRPPDWSLGVWLSRAYYRTPEECVAVAKQVRENRIPCDVITFDGRAWQDTPTRFLFEWDKSRFKDPASTCSELKDLGFRICNWQYPLVSTAHPDYPDLAIKGYFLKDAKTGGPYVYQWDPGPFGAVLTPLPPSSIIDFTNPAAYDFWKQAHKPVFDVGVDVFKPDFGEQVPDDVVAFNGDSGKRLHSVYTALYNRCVFEATAEYGPGPEPVVWARSSWIGAQRYPVQWGGDPQTDWEAMAASIRGGLSWGMSGVPYHASDVGGFYGASQPDAELYVRWVQAGIHISHFRFHGIGVREPWGFGEEALSIVRKALEWRYRLIPYLARCLDEAATASAPVQRAMAYAFPSDRHGHLYETQFMCGPSLLVAPIIAPGGEVEVYLPAGERWVDLHSGAVLEGAQRLFLTCGLDRIPVFGRVGQEIQLGPIVQHLGECGGKAKVEEIWRFTPRGIEKRAS